MEEKFWSASGHRWVLIDQKYFETILIDFFGRPDGWWHGWLFYENNQLRILIKPKKHTNRNGYARDYNGKFHLVRWVDL